MLHHAALTAFCITANPLVRDISSDSNPRHPQGTPTAYYAVQCKNDRPEISGSKCQISGRALIAETTKRKRPQYSLLTARSVVDTFPVSPPPPPSSTVVAISNEPTYSTKIFDVHAVDTLVCLFPRWPTPQRWLATHLGRGK